jgi:hypothetical protein
MSFSISHALTLTNLLILTPELRPMHASASPHHHLHQLDARLPVLQCGWARIKLDLA